MPIRIDTRRSPILRVDWEGAPSEEEMRAHLLELTSLIRSLPTNTILYDARSTSGPSAIQRQLMADWMKENELLIKNRSAGTAFVISSALIRGALTAILWLQPMSTEHTVVATPEEAYRWCEEQLRKREAKRTTSGGAR